MINKYKALIIATIITLFSGAYASYAEEETFNLDFPNKCSHPDKNVNSFITNPEVCLFLESIEPLFEATSRELDIANYKIKKLNKSIKKNSDEFQAAEKEYQREIKIYEKHDENIDTILSNLNKDRSQYIVQTFGTTKDKLKSFINYFNTVEHTLLMKAHENARIIAELKKYRDNYDIALKRNNQLFNENKNLRNQIRSTNSRNTQKAPRPKVNKPRQKFEVPKVYTKTFPFNQCPGAGKHQLFIVNVLNRAVTVQWRQRKGSFGQYRHKSQKIGANGRYNLGCLYDRSLKATEVNILGYQ